VKKAIVLQSIKSSKFAWHTGFNVESRSMITRFQLPALKQLKRQLLTLFQREEPAYLAIVGHEGACVDDSVIMQDMKMSGRPSATSISRVLTLAILVYDDSVIYNGKRTMKPLALMRFGHVKKDIFKLGIPPHQNLVNFTLPPTPSGQPRWRIQLAGVYGPPTALPPRQLPPSLVQ
jgi:hypothetical protein